MFITRKHLKYIGVLGVIVYAFNPYSQETGRQISCEMKANLFYKRIPGQLETLPQKDKTSEINSCAKKWGQYFLIDKKEQAVWVGNSEVAELGPGRRLHTHAQVPYWKGPRPGL